MRLSVKNVGSVAISSLMLAWPYEVSTIAEIPLMPDTHRPTRRDKLFCRVGSGWAVWMRHFIVTIFASKASGGLTNFV